MAKWQIEYGVDSRHTGGGWSDVQTIKADTAEEATDILTRTYSGFDDPLCEINSITEVRTGPFIKKLKMIGYIIFGLCILYGIGLTNITEFIKGMIEGLE